MNKIVLFALLFAGNLLSQGVDSEDMPKLAAPAGDRLLVSGYSRPAAEKSISVRSYGLEYFPLDFTRQYFFDSDAGDAKACIDTVGEERIFTFNASGIRYSQKLHTQPDGIFLTRTESKAFLFFGSRITYPEPALRLPLPLKIGEKWHWEGLETTGDDSTLLTIDGEVLGEELIITPAGQFECIKIRQHVASVGGSSSVVTEWLAPNIGIVKSHSKFKGSGFTAILQKILGLDEITMELARIE